jgi:hypothetical protein
MGKMGNMRKGEEEGGVANSKFGFLSSPVHPFHPFPDPLPTMQNVCLLTPTDFPFPITHHPFP